MLVKDTTPQNLILTNTLQHEMVDRSADTHRMTIYGHAIYQQSL